MTGRPEHEPTDITRKQVANLSAGGMKQENVAKFMGLSVPTLMKHYRHEYENGNELMVAELIPVCMAVARDPDHKDSAKERHFLLERKGGFIKTEKQEVHNIAPFEVVIQAVSPDEDTNSSADTD